MNAFPWGLAGQVSTIGIIVMALVAIGYKTATSFRSRPVRTTPEQELAEIQERVRHSAQWESIYDPKYE